jgi:hypothetical protein
MRDVTRGAGPRSARVSYEAKKMLVASSLRALGVMFELVSEHSPELATELADWEEGRVVGLGVLPNGPAISLLKQQERIRFLGTGLQNPAIGILFKNMDSAVMTFSGQIGAHMASIEHRAVVHGNVVHAMQTVRAMNIVQKFLMPTLLLNRTTKKPVRLSRTELRTKARVLAGLVPRLVTTFGR